ncbi:hypothetical protein [uncultured Sphingosinicella sp.]|jgi:hypothetical protein|uniref:hypothetical protein n=1 Tax=uncultured Sphingosinicella sp. TaxID=478748 RepID=UPI0030DAAEFA|tara:strand:+ start:16059 stop:16409 length:351 start_codon:yes stop_codon:yes gene_type:complete
MSFEAFADQINAMVLAGTLLTRRADVILQATVQAHVTDPDAFNAIVKAVSDGQVSEDQLRTLTERAPAFVDMLRAGLRPLLGPANEARLTGLARYGHITTSVLDRALGNVLRAKAA